MSLFGITSLVTDVYSRTVSLLLLAPIAVFAVMLSGAFDTVPGDALADVILTNGQAVAHLAIRNALLVVNVSIDWTELAADATT